jgi:hypothetical protein
MIEELDANEFDASKASELKTLLAGIEMAKSGSKVPQFGFKGFEGSGRTSQSEKSL